VRAGSVIWVALALAGCSAPMVEPVGSGQPFPLSEPLAPAPIPTPPLTPPAAMPPVMSTTTPRPMTTSTPFHARFAAAAVAYLSSGTLDGPRRGRSMNCTGLVQACYDVLGCDERPEGSTRDLHAWCVANDQTVDTPAPGDLVFFDDTWDRDDDGRLDDPLTHVGVVVEAEPDGRVRFIHVGSRKLKDGVLHLGRSEHKRDERGNLLNSPLRVRHKRDPRGTRYLAGQLLRGFCRPRACGPASLSPL